MALLCRDKSNAVFERGALKLLTLCCVAISNSMKYRCLVVNISLIANSLIKFAAVHLPIEQFFL
jgi:hypothetical protein